MNKINISPGFKRYFANTSWLMGHCVLSTAIKKKGGSEGVVLLLGGCGAWISIGRSGETFWYDWSRGGVCCAKG